MYVRTDHRIWRWFGTKNGCRPTVSKFVGKSFLSGSRQVSQAIGQAIS